jgi:hypothetical protein
MNVVATVALTLSLTTVSCQAVRTTRLGVLADAACLESDSVSTCQAKVTALAGMPQQQQRKQETTCVNLATELQQPQPSSHPPVDRPPSRRQ